MVVCESEDEARTRFLVSINKLVWLPVQKRPLRAQVLISKTGGVSIVFKMVFVLLRPLYVHVSCVPIALLRNTLRAPVGPKSEFCIAIPFGGFVLQKGVPVRFIRARTIEPSDWRLHRDSIPGIGNSREFLRSIIGIWFPGGRVQLLSD